MTVRRTETSMMTEQIIFLHACMFNPAPSTLIKALDIEFLETFPGLTSANIRNHLLKSIAKTMGHLQQTWKNTQSTRTKEKDPKEKKTVVIAKDVELIDPNKERTHNVYANAIDVRKE